MLRHAFRAMGTEVELLLDAEPSAESDARSRRGRARVRAAGGAPLPLPPRLRALGAQPRRLRSTPATTSPRVTRLARRGAGAHRRPVRPDRPRRARRRRLRPHVRRARPGRRAARTPPRPCGGGVRVDGRRIELEPGFRLDLGGIAKGYAVDRAAALLAAAGPVPRQRGRRPRRRGRLWPVGVETADGELTLGLEDGALATSGRDRRRWRRDGREQHHLIDPATGAPAESDLLRVTARRPDRRRGRGAREGDLPRRAARQTPAVLVTADGRTVLAGGLA